MNLNTLKKGVLDTNLRSILSFLLKKRKDIDVFKKGKTVFTGIVILNSKSTDK